MLYKITFLFIVVPGLISAQELGALRAQSALLKGDPFIESLEADGKIIWKVGTETPAEIKTGQKITIRGKNLGSGPDIDFSRILIGNVRAMERDLPMYKGAIKPAKMLFYEKPKLFDSWLKDIQSWNDNEIVFLVPETATQGPLLVSVQKRHQSLESLTQKGISHLVFDPLTERIEKRSFKHTTDVISYLGPVRFSQSVPLKVSNPRENEFMSYGQASYWSYDYNIGLTHWAKEMNWTALMKGEVIDPFTGKIADPEELFGAFLLHKDEAPKVATEPFYFDPYPIPMPVKPFLVGTPLYKGMATPSGFVGHVYNEVKNPMNNKVENWIGVSCAACHTNRVTYEAAPGKTVTELFEGIPNPKWTMKWSVLGKMHGIVTEEEGPDGKKEKVDKSQLIYHMPNAAAENSIIRESNDGSRFGNDHLFAPVVIPIITRHTPIRRALARTELIAGFEGSYIHAEEPDGAIGAMSADALKALTVYMASLDKNDRKLEHIGLYRWVKTNDLLQEIENSGEGSFLQSGKESHPTLMARIGRGEKIFNQNCASCHASNQGTYTDENMIGLDKVGTYFSPSIFHREMQSIRTAILRNLYWVEKRGLLHDGHVKTLEDLVNPERCQEDSDLYRRYYTINSTTFKIPKGSIEQERATRRQAYFVDVPGDKDHLYWDYQGMRRAFGPREFGVEHSIALPAAPHPWCAGSKDEVQDLVAFLLTL